MSATRHRADVDPLVEEALAHPDTVAEDRATAERARRIDCDDRHARGPFAIDRGKSVDERRFAAARWPGDPHDLGVTGIRIERPHRLGRARLVVLNNGDEARDRPFVAQTRAAE